MAIALDVRRALIDDPQFDAVLDLVVSAAELDFYADRVDALAVHVAQRLKARELDDCAAYVRLLNDEQSGEAELDRLIELATVGETHFGRPRQLFDALRDVVLPEIIERNRASRRLRIWSAGCSIGAEAYSVSILLRRELASLTEGWNISIIGADVNRQSLSQAAEGRYEERTLCGTPPGWREECFRREGDWRRIDARFQEGVTFQCHNLARDPYPSLAHNLVAFDLVLCRNVLIYFGQDFAQRVFGKLADCLVEGGWLAVGHAETGCRLPVELQPRRLAGATLFQKGKSAVVLPDGPPPRAEASRRVCLPQRAAPDPETSVTVNEAGSQVDAIRALADQARIDEALELCETLIGGDPLNAIYKFHHARLLDERGAHVAARQSLQQAVRLVPDFPLAHYSLGCAFERAGDAAEARKAFQNVIRLLADRPPAEPIDQSNGLTAAELAHLANQRCEALDAPRSATGREDFEREENTDERRHRCISAV